MPRSKAPGAPVARKVIALHQQGYGPAEAAKELNCNSSYAYKVIRLHKLKVDNGTILDMHLMLQEVLERVRRIEANMLCRRKGKVAHGVEQILEQGI